MSEDHGMSVTGQVLGKTTYKEEPLILDLGYQVP